MSQNSIPLSELESSPAAKFEKLGDHFAGEITAMNQRQQTDINTGAALTFNDGTPRMMWVISLRQADGDTVALYARGGKFKAANGEGESMLNAIAAAVRASKATSIEVGGQLAVAWTGESESQAGRNPARLYRAQYKAPAPVADSIPVDLFGGGGGA